MSEQQRQPEQQQQEQQQQQQPEQQQPSEQQQQRPNLPEFLFPFTFVIRQQPSPQNTNDQSTTSPSPVAAHFFFYPINGTGVGSGDQSPPPFIFFTPFFFPQENRKNVSESTMKKLPIVEITKEHIDAQTSCPICLEPFFLLPNNDDQRNDENSTDKETSSLPEPIRQMPCEHTFCESCLFRWLKQNNTCPLCRKEIESENVSQQSEQTTESTTISPQEDVTTDDASSSTSTESNSSFAQFSHTHSSHYHHNNNNSQVSTSCDLRSVGCCGELQSNEESHTTSPIVTLPQCHHQFHASCLRTSLIVEGYSFESPTSQQLCFHCPICRSPAIIQSDVLKTLPAILPGNLSSPQEQQQSSSQIPVVISHLPPNPDEMDLD